MVLPPFSAGIALSSVLHTMWASQPWSVTGRDHEDPFDVPNHVSPLLHGHTKIGTYVVETATSWKLVQTTTKKLFKFTKKNHTCRWYDDTQLCKICCPNSTSFVRYKNNKEICYFYISQTKSSLDKIFTTLCIIYMCDFFGEFKRLFCRSLHGFSRRLWFSQDMFPTKIYSLLLFSFVDVSVRRPCSSAKYSSADF